MSLLKYQKDPQVVEGNGRGPLHFHRAHLDGLPFRGNVPLLREDEFHDVCETVYDAKLDIFDVRDPEQKKQLEEILDRAANGWYRILAKKPEWVQLPDGTKTVLVYVEWAIPHKEVNWNRMSGLPAGTLSR